MFTGGLISELSGHEGNISAVAFNSIGSMIVTAGEDNKARIYQISLGLIYINNVDTTVKLLHTLIYHTDHITSVEFSPNGYYVVTCSRDQSAGLWDMNGRMITKFSGHEEILTKVHFVEGNGGE